MNTLKHDLSFDSAQLDFQALTRTAAIAYGKSRAEVEAHLSELQHLLTDKEYKAAKFPLEAEWLAQAAEQMAVAARTYHTLLGAADRAELSIVNKPKETTHG